MLTMRGLAKKRPFYTNTSALRCRFFSDKIEADESSIEVKAVKRNLPQSPLKMKFLVNLVSFWEY